MTQDFFLGQLRLIMVAVIAFAAGKGWLSTDTTTLLGTVLAPVGLLFGPWLWSIYRNVNMKLVPKNSVAVPADQAQVSVSGTHAVITGATTRDGGVVAKVVGVLLFAFVLSAFLAGTPAQAQGLPKPRPLTGNIVKDIEAAKEQTRAAVTGKPAPSSDAPLPCTFQMLTKLTPGNLLSTINQCIAGKLVSDTQRALASAQVFGTTGKGDADAVNCLTPALAIFQAGVEIPAVPDTPAVINADGSVKTPAVAGTSAQEPGPILLYQKYREFTLSGALTSCQSWFNGPINATAAAGLGAASTALGAAAILAPIK